MKKGMKKEGTKRVGRAKAEEDTMRPEYDFSKAERGTTSARYAQGTNVVVLDPDVVRMFPNAAAVNQALRALGEIIKQASPAKGRKSGSSG
jgi:hypothetical protein